MRRFSAFVFVGLVGFVVQMVALIAMTAWLRWPYPLATILAVEAAVLHNFAWHERWTWTDRSTPGGGTRRLLRFHAGAGLTSMAGTLLVTVAAVESLGLHPAAANAVAVVLTSAANFTLADRWVFVPTRNAVAVLALAMLVMPSTASAAPEPETLAAWGRYVDQVEAARARHETDAPVTTPVGRTMAVPGGTIHEWRGSLLVRGITVPALVGALMDPGLPPPSEDLLEARVLRKSGETLSVYLKVARSALVTVTYDTEHDVTFVRHSEAFATSRSVSTRIAETDGNDRGFLWRLNSYWRYRQVGDAVQLDVLSLSLSCDVPGLLRPVANPIVNGIARESMRHTLEAMERFAVTLRPPHPQRHARWTGAAHATHGAGSLMVQAENGRTSTPDDSSPARNQAARAGAPGLSPCRQIVSTSIGSTVPSSATTVFSVAMRMARVTTSSTPRISAPGA